MNLKAACAACVFAALSICTISARAEVTVKPQTYTYGTHLDIRKVLSSSEDATPDCGVVNAHLTYLDSHGQSRTLDYLKAADTCNAGN
ncbi:DUF2790 domain-containing protein [Pseudomonas akapageensis]|uniref:DUF2790 domain-containing protein n=1 Tax=Pseudomonas akapageensis TaxID=2609961 RepID=UPI001408F53E|nr:DUF2790 domain-containing protein [Pseudomonas akapageensis]